VSCVLSAAACGPVPNPENYTIVFNADGTLSGKTAATRSPARIRSKTA
jgi:hypothetical protein